MKPLNSDNHIGAWTAPYEKTFCSARSFRQNITDRTKARFLIDTPPPASKTKMTSVLGYLVKSTNGISCREHEWPNHHAQSSGTTVHCFELTGKQSSFDAHVTALISITNENWPLEADFPDFTVDEDVK